MERGSLHRDAFMQEIARMTQTIVKRAKEYDSDTIPGDYATLETPCPHCGAQVKENYRRFACTKCEFSISKIPGGRQFEIPEVEELLREKTIGPLSGFRSKMGRPFSAILKLALDDEIKNFKLEFDFGQDTGGEDGEPPDFSEQTPVGACPKCQSRVYEHGMSYVCENSVANPKTCDFRSGKVILQQEIAREQMQKLLGEGRTDLLTGFKSSRTGRNFKAFLVKQPDGKIGFEFEKKEGKPAAKTAAKRGAAASEAPADNAEDGDSDVAVAAKTTRAKPAAKTVAAKKTPAAKKVAAKKTAARKTGS
jgi:DNA topoisomerase III